MFARARRNSAIGGVAAALVAPVYLLTMSRSIGFMDRGELAAVASTWGIAHATGYPTLMLLAGALVHLVPLRPVLLLNVFAAALVALGAALLAVLLDDLAARLAPALSSRVRGALAVGTSFVTGLTITWWRQANGFEVYPLHCVFMPLVTLLALRWLDAACAGDRSAQRRAFAFALVTGLSFTNHMTTVLLAPGLLTIAVARLGFRRFAGALRWLVPAFALGLIPYVWLPLRASMHPTFGWGDPQTLPRFLHHVTGADYRDWMFSGAGTTLRQLRFMAWRIASDFSWLGVAIVGLGAALLARRQRWIGVLAGLLVAAGVVFASNYRIPDIDSYLLTAVFGLSILLLAGMVRVAERFGTRVAVGCGLALVLSGASFHWRECDESPPSLAESFFRDVVTPLPANSLLFTAVWGQVVSPSWYFQSVEGVRADVTIVDTNLARVSWYLDQIERRSPELVERVRPEFASYRGLLVAAERHRSRDSRAIEKARRTFLAALAESAMSDRAVFSMGDLPEPHPGWTRAPYHLVDWLRSDSAYVAEPPYRYAFRPWRGRVDEDVALTCRAYAESRVRRAYYEEAHGHRENVAALVFGVAGFDPGIRPEDIGPMPLESELTVLAASKYFRDLAVARQRAGGAAAATPRRRGRRAATGSAS